MKEILLALKNNKIIEANNLKTQLWIFHPRIIQSLILVSQGESIESRNKQVEAKKTANPPPESIINQFKEFKIGIGNDNVFKEKKTNDLEDIWDTIKRGDIWIIE